ncbi:MAG: hypothetical protein P4L59_12720 [Desulfosporosinus sp.]|nr:hypothetical protein [Desulfosporosinus sp.]
MYVGIYDGSQEPYMSMKLEHTDIARSPTDEVLEGLANLKEYKN